MSRSSSASRVSGARWRDTLTPAAIAVFAGAAVEIAITHFSGRREAWDSPSYWMVGYPVLIVVCALLGWLWPAAAVRVGFVAAIAQVLTMMLRTGGATLWPLGLVLGAVLGVPCALAANAGRRMRRPARAPRA